MPLGTRSASEARISVVVPVFNEEMVLPELRRRLVTTLEKVNSDFEVLLVDDGSSDGTAALADRFCEEDRRFKCVHFSRNFGHQAAVTAGLAYSSGDLTCVMDADLQDPPEVLLSLLAEWEKGNDVVYRIRQDRKEHWVKVARRRIPYGHLRQPSSTIWRSEATSSRGGWRVVAPNEWPSRIDAGTS